MWRLRLSEGVDRGRQQEKDQGSLDFIRIEVGIMRCSAAGFDEGVSGWYKRVNASG